MKRETKSKIVNILFFISLIICLFLISNTYAKYLEQVNTSYQSSAKMWKVVVNNKIIREETTLTNVISPNFDSNDYIKDGVIVPGGEGHFDMEIDFSNVDVPFTLDFSVEQNETEEGVYNALPDFKYLGYSLEEKEVIYYNLPEGYIQLDFIESTGEQYIDTLAKGTGVDKIELSKSTTSQIVPTVVEVEPNSDDRNIILLASYLEDPATGIGNFETTRIYGCKIYLDNVIIRELVPCYDTVNDVNGLFDMITGQFLGNSGTGEFADTSKENDKCIIDPESGDFTDEKANAVAYIRWIDGDGTEESLEDELDNTEDTTFIEEVSNTPTADDDTIKYKASIIFEQYIED